MSKLSPTLQSVWRTFTSLTEPVRLPLTFQPLSLKWVNLIGPQSEPWQSSYTTQSLWSQIAHL